MRDWFRFVLPLLVAALLSACTSPADNGQFTDTPQPTDTPRPEATSPSIETMAREVVDLLAQNEFEEAASSFDAKMKQVLLPETLEEIWATLTEQMGPFQRQLGARIEELEEYRAVYVTTEFARATIDTQVVFDHNGQVAGLFFVPPRAPGGAGDASLEYYVSPDYVDTEAFEERNLVIGASGWVMPATFTFPVGEGPFPVVLLVHDSGPHDRDETVGLNKPFRDLAWGLASQGIAVLRYEKRTKTHPERIQAIQQRYTIYDEAVNDAVAAVSLLAKMKDVDSERVYVLGHGLGGMLVPRIGALAPDIAGFIVLAGTTRPLEDVYLAQVSYAFEFDGELSDQEQATLEEAKEQVARVKDPDLSAETPPSQLPRGIPGSYWLDLRGYDPAEAAKDLTQPMLVLQGERDFQITVEDFEGWRAALSLRTDVEFQLYPALNHLFVAGEGPSMPNEEYAAPGHVAAHVIGDIVDWIERH